MYHSPPTMKNIFIQYLMRKLKESQSNPSSAAAWKKRVEKESGGTDRLCG